MKEKKEIIDGQEIRIKEDKEIIDGQEIRIEDGKEIIDGQEIRVKDGKEIIDGQEIRIKEDVEIIDGQEIRIKEDKESRIKEKKESNNKQKNKTKEKKESNKRQKDKIKEEKENDDDQEGKPQNDIQPSKNVGKIALAMQAISIVPLILFAVIIGMIASHQFKKAMYTEVENNFSTIGKNVEMILDASFPGDYRLEDVGTNGGLKVYKGDTDITSRNDLIDQIKKDNKLEITLFYEDTRILTTLEKANGDRMIGTGAPAAVMEQVYKSDTAKFFTNSTIDGEQFFTYYKPIHNSDNTVVGMVAIAKSSAEVHSLVNQSVLPLLIADGILVIIVSVMNLAYTKSFAKVLLKIHSFLADVSTGNLNAILDKSVLRRHDEFGDIGRSALSMQNSLRHLIEQDALTGLYNRRSANRRMIHVVSKAEQKQQPFAICIGDIDFFKKVNDTYGHDAGDEVLKTVADTLREHMLTCGFVARWGGEEFLLVFDHMDAEKAGKSLNALLEKIRKLRIPYGDLVISVTMTFGVANGDHFDISKLLKDADDKLYYGKENGRNRVITD